MINHERLTSKFYIYRSFGVLLYYNIVLNNILWIKYNRGKKKNILTFARI